MKKVRHLSKQDGFTLVEMMVVLLIIGVLVTIATLSFVFSVVKAKETVCKSNRRIIKGALNEYCLKNGVYPASLNDLVPDYLESDDVFYCPETANRYEYDTNADQSSYTLTCPGCGE